MTFPVPPSHILCDGAIPATVSAFAREHGLTISTKDTIGSFPNILVLSHITDARLNKFLLPPTQACFESHGDDTGLKPGVFERIKDNNLYLSLTTQTAYQTSVAPCVVKWMAAQTSISNDLLSNLELAVQEALANALIHGNMGLQKTLPDSFHDLRSYNTTIRERLSDEQHGLLRLELTAKWCDDHIELAIQDDGPGFDANSTTDKSITGWGLSLIHQLAFSVDVSEGGRKITMRFIK